MVLYVGVLLIIVVVSFQLFVAFYPSFGGDLTKELQEQYVDSQQFENGIFHNQNRETAKDFGLSKVLKIIQNSFLKTLKTEFLNKT